MTTCGHLSPQMAVSEYRSVSLRSVPGILQAVHFQSHRAFLVGLPVVNCTLGIAFCVPGLTLMVPRVHRGVMVCVCVSQERARFIDGNAFMEMIIVGWNFLRF